MVSGPSALRYSGVVLAGGRSTRMGTDKAFLRIGNELLIERQLRCLHEARAAELLISGRADVDYSRFGAKVLRDAPGHEGPLAGVAAALKASSSGLVFVLAVDMPAVTSAMIATILSRCDQASGCVPIDRQGFQPLCAAYPKGLLRVAEHLLRMGENSMHEFVGKAIDEGLLCTLKVEPPDYGCFANANLPDEWTGIAMQPSDH